MEILRNSACQWQEYLSQGQITSVELVDLCLDQIEKHNRQGQCLNALISTAPRDTVYRRAQLLDKERVAGAVRGPMHGIPIIIKDIISTSEQHGMATTCGAHALRVAFGKHDCLLVQRLIAAGLIIIGKSNLNEYCRLRDVKSGWSALGGQTQSPYILGGLKPDELPVGNTTISGSSSGSAAGVAAGFAPISIGTETTGSLVIPANRGGLYSLKVTNSRAPKEGILCLSYALDSIGAMAKCASDVRDMTAIILGKEETLTPKMPTVARHSLRVGFLNSPQWRFPNEYCSLSDHIRHFLDESYIHAIQALSASGIECVSGIEMSDEDIDYNGQSIIGLAIDHEFSANFADFLLRLQGTEIDNLADLIAYNETHADVALPPPSRDQKNLKSVQELHASHELASEALEHGRKLARERLDRAMVGIDLLIGPGDSQLFAFAARAGYPIASVPWLSVTYEEGGSRPEGFTILGREDSEDVILDFMLRYEEVFPDRPLPAPLLEQL